jgi:hypothetical protein
MSTSGPRAGTRHHLAKLNDHAVWVIRTSGKSYAELAAIYGVSAVTIWAAKFGHSWKHVPMPEKRPALKKQEQEAAKAEA